MTVLRHRTAETAPVRRTEAEPTVIALPGPAEVALVPVRRDGRMVGAYVLSGETVHYRPVVDLDQALSAVAGIAAVVVAGAAFATARRRPPAVGTMTMGPGGWVSFKGGTAPPLRPAGKRPWWAHILRARRLVVD